MKTRVKVLRFDKNKEAQSFFEEYEVAYSDGMTVLDALRQIQVEFDPSLAFRWECSKGTCGTCGVMLNGKPVMSCHEHLNPNEIAIITPLSKFPIDKDLTVDLTVTLERLKLTNPYIVLGDQSIQSKLQADASRLLRTCMECWICVSVCPMVESPADIADPVGMVSLARYHLDVRDNLDRPELARDLGIKLYNCEKCQLCVNVCPKGINIPVDAIKILLDDNRENEA
jgi:succinate dehydrogenase/fumarate reductase iron-sulfur protein